MAHSVDHAARVVLGLIDPANAWSLLFKVQRFVFVSQSHFEEHLRSDITFRDYIAEIASLSAKDKNELVKIAHRQGLVKIVSGSWRQRSLSANADRHEVGALLDSLRLLGQHLALDAVWTRLQQLLNPPAVAHANGRNLPASLSVAPQSLSVPQSIVSVSHPKKSHKRRKTRKSAKTVASAPGPETNVDQSRVAIEQNTNVPTLNNEVEQNAAHATDFASRSERRESRASGNHAGNDKPNATISSVAMVKTLEAVTPTPTVPSVQSRPTVISTEEPTRKRKRDESSAEEPEMNIDAPQPKRRHPKITSPSVLPSGPKEATPSSRSKSAPSKNDVAESTSTITASSAAIVDSPTKYMNALSSPPASRKDVGLQSQVRSSHTSRTIGQQTASTSTSKGDLATKQPQDANRDREPDATTRATTSAASPNPSHKPLSDSQHEHKTYFNASDPASKKQSVPTNPRQGEGVHKIGIDASNAASKRSIISPTSVHKTSFNASTHIGNMPVIPPKPPTKPEPLRANDTPVQSREPQAANSVPRASGPKHVIDAIRRLEKYTKYGDENYPTEDEDSTESDSSSSSDEESETVRVPTPVAPTANLSRPCSEALDLDTTISEPSFKQSTLTQASSRVDACESDDLLLKAPVTTRTKDAPTSGKRKRQTHKKVSKYFDTTPENPKRVPAGTSAIAFPSTKAFDFGLIQEKLADDPYRLLLATTFLNKTAGRVAVPAFYQLMAQYPTPVALANANTEDVSKIIHHLGFQNHRAETLRRMARIWLEQPPEKGVRYRTRNYPKIGDGVTLKPAEVVLEDAVDCSGALEIGHIPGCGPYAYDSWRIFCRDDLREIRAAEVEPEWKRVLPADKELRAYLRWMWLREGIIWDPLTGESTKASSQQIADAERGAAITVSPETANDMTEGQESILPSQGRAESPLVASVSQDDDEQNMRRESRSRGTSMTTESTPPRTMQAQNTRTRSLRRRDSESTTIPDVTQGTAAQLSDTTDGDQDQDFHLTRESRTVAKTLKTWSQEQGLKDNNLTHRETSIPPDPQKI